MDRVVFLNGDFIPEGEAKLSIFDRGLLFADAVYEGFGILDGQITDFAYHRWTGSTARLPSSICCRQCRVTRCWRR